MDVKLRYDENNNVCLKIGKVETFVKGTEAISEKDITTLVNILSKFKNINIYADWTKKLCM